jgi:hypothetical protein
MRASLAVGVPTILLALPLYDKLYYYPGTWAALRLIAFVQLIPAILLYGVDAGMRRLPRGQRLAELFWLSAVVVVLIATCRYTQVQMAPDWRGMPRLARLGIGMLAIGGSVAAAVWLPRFLLRYFARLAPLALVLTAYAVFQPLVSAIAADVAEARAVPDHPSVAQPKRTDAVFIFILDELGRDVLLDGDTIDRSRFPNLAQVAGEGLWFSNAVSNAGDTCISIPSMLTGRFYYHLTMSLPRDCKNFYLASSEHNVLSVLSTRYEIALYDSTLRDCLPSSNAHCYGTPYLMAEDPTSALLQHLLLIAPDDARRKAIASPFGEVVTTHGYDRLLLDRLQSDIADGSVAGRVNFVHVTLPHVPYIYDERGGLHGSRYNGFNGKRPDDEYVQANYSRQMQYVDSMIGRFLTALKRADLYESATIVFTADHGPRSPDGFVGTLFPARLSTVTPNVPVLVRGPNVHPGVDNREYQHVDFAPTLLDALGVPITELGDRIDGRSALRQETSARDRYFRWQNYMYRFDNNQAAWVLNGPA